ncbi:hypothetical protein MPDQ_000605 [Monascus purpureus]|uniref:Uncharacterized protein n=1 Tax=Monascus purpureus TaxID=5098 RepID=A0A507QRT6_MONPU|nr:hypothetical protein MPDQ_000605 [Monascus purpureus]
MVLERVNPSSGVQIHGLLYRFHPAVHYDSPYPSQREVRRQIYNLWKRYGLEHRTIFDTPVRSVRRNKEGKFVINQDEGKYGSFDGVIAAVGVSGDLNMPLIQGQEKFKGQISHSSQLNDKGCRNKKVVIIGGGASAVEALQVAVQAGAARVDVLSRTDKWIIPRNILVQTLVASNLWGEEGFVAWIPEWLLKKFFYRDLQDMVPSTGLYTASPLVNSELFYLIRQGSATWRRGDVLGVEQNAVRFNSRGKGAPKGGPGREELVAADVIVMATGWKRASLGFLPRNCFEDEFRPPNWYMQVFPPGYPDICAINSTYINAIGTAGYLHIGIYTRFLLAFIMDPMARPTEGRMKVWIDFMRYTKRSDIPAFEFLTYAELIYWCIVALFLDPFRWKWVLFVLTGKGGSFPEKIIEKESPFRESQEERETQ